MIEFLVYTLVFLPPIIVGIFFWIAMYKKWWSYWALGNIGGFVIGVLFGIYYLILFNGFEVRSLLPGWPIWLIILAIGGFGGRSLMSTSFTIWEQRQLRKELKKKKTSM